MNKYHTHRSLSTPTLKDAFKRYAPLLLWCIIVSACNAPDNNSKAASTTKDDASNSTQNPVAQPAIETYLNDPSTATLSAYGPGSITRNVMQDRYGNIWLASWEGVIRYGADQNNNTATGKGFTNITIKEKLKPFHVFSLFEDKIGNVWIGTIGGGVYRYDGKTYTNFTTNDGLIQNDVCCISEDKNGNIWFGTQGGASCYDGQSFRNFTTKEGLIGDKVNAIVDDKNGKIWLGTNNGLCFADEPAMSAGPVLFTHFLNKKGLPFYNIRSIVEDRQGNLWLGSEQGLCRYDGKSFTDFTKNFVGCVFEDSKGNIWISAANKSNHMTLSRYSGKTLPIQPANYTLLRDEDMQVFGIEEDSEGNIWFGTEHGVFCYDGTKIIDLKKSGGGE